MPLIKLDAIDSTNDYLKQLSKESDLENYTVVMANEQTKGKGQMGSKWISEKGKNLTMSVLVTDFPINTKNIFDLNIATALSVIRVLKNSNVSNVSIKWPNDIMADSKKVAGILIENSFKSTGSFIAVVGIGLNLNQTNFDLLPQATSLKKVTGKIYDLEEIANQLRNSLEVHLQRLRNNADALWEEYHQNIFRINYPSAFEDSEGQRFMGIIQGVTRDGKLELLLEDDSFECFEVKKVKLLY
ncbi:biotin--[acetyl-CoA-carboxylase] ligase [Flavobacterium sp.]|uniref:biotin--[acetyl-CoA-carboxylase] ligase n=1 Tax=Flavobacterium sp. TaxID=239 RepID=UPI002489D16D|nr:biotin--[acetyl-CoA-carboxylase] ligase [Flavobacterium sp.]MDI1316109.1 biotin--[acetyl-CoA-carboxylase] ligase [Flavobacterium sp.]